MQTQPSFLKRLSRKNAAFHALVTVLCISVIFAPIPAQASQFDPNCVTSILMHTHTGEQLVNVPNAKHGIVRQFLEPDGLRIKRSNIRPLKEALGLQEIQVAGYFDCPGGSCGAKQISAHPRDRDAEGRLSCDKCGTPITESENPFYEVFDENGAVPLDRLILEPNVAAKYPDKPLYRCDHCGVFNYQDSGNCGGCGGAPPENPTYIQPEKEKPLKNDYRDKVAAEEKASSEDEALILIAFIVGAIVVAGVITVIVIAASNAPSSPRSSSDIYYPRSTYSPPVSSPPRRSSPSHDWGSSSRRSSPSRSWGGSSSPSRSFGGSNRGGSNNRNGTFKY